MDGGRLIIDQLQGHDWKDKVPSFVKEIPVQDKYWSNMISCSRVARVTEQYSDRAWIWEKIGGTLLPNRGCTFTHNGHRFYVILKGRTMQSGGTHAIYDETSGVIADASLIDSIPVFVDLLSDAKHTAAKYVGGYPFVEGTRAERDRERIRVIVEEHFKKGKT